MRIRAFAAAVVLSFPAAAQNYPAKPVKLICPFPPAGTPKDIIAKLNMEAVKGAKVD